MLFFFLFFCFSLGKRELVQIQLLTRHGDRTSIEPNPVLPNCPIDFTKTSGITPGALTPLGEYQCYQMGVWVKNRYIDADSQYYIKNISSLFNRQEYEFKSSQHHRTVRSAWSMTKGLFPVGHKIDIGSKNYSLPYAAQSVPILVVYEEQNDKIFVEGDICTVKKRVFNEWLDSKEGKEAIKKLNEKYMKTLNTIAGTDFSISEVIRIQDVAVILDDHDLLQQTEDCKKIHDALPFIQDAIADWFETRYTHSLPSFIGGGFVAEYLSYVSKFLQSEQKNNDILKRTGPKFVHFSGHDSSFLYILFGLELHKDYPLTWHQPHFGSALVFELWYDDVTEEYFVQVVYRDGWDGNPVNLVLKSFGCESSMCEFNVFNQMAKEKLILSDEEWCKKCENVSAEFCKK